MTLAIQGLGSTLIYINLIFSHSTGKNIKINFSFALWFLTLTGLAECRPTLTIPHAQANFKGGQLKVKKKNHHRKEDDMLMHMV